MDNYWTRRADLLMKSVHQETDQVLKQVLNGYNQALSEINTTINILLYKGKYGSESVDDLLSVATTKQEVDKLYKLLGSVSDADEKAYYKLQIDQLAYKARIARAEIVKANIQMQIGKLTQAQENLVHSGFSDIAGNVYDKSIFEVQQQFGYAFAFERPNSRMVEQVIKSNWSGVVWSDRLWKNNQQLAESLQHTLTKGLSQGKSYFLMARDLKEEMGSAEYPAVRLIRTEASYIANKARLQALTNSGVSELEFVAVLDARTSDICQENDGAIVPVDKVVFGLNIPPLHPNCRSTFVAKIDDAYKKNMTRLSYNPVTGEKEKVPRSMTYNEWKQSMYDRYGRPATDTAIKQIKNTNADRIQYEKYKETVSNTPDTFENFQEMKYNESTSYERLVTDFKDEKIRIRIRNNDIDLTINPEKQMRHVLGEGYIPGRSYLYPGVDPQDLVNTHAGTGKFLRADRGRWTKKEVIELDHDIGVNVVNGQEEPTDSVKIHYSNTGTHVVPTRRKETKK